jgi:hypothetical protein
LISRVT